MNEYYYCELVHETDANEVRTTHSSEFQSLVKNK